MPRPFLAQAGKHLKTRTRIGPKYGSKSADGFVSSIVLTILKMNLDVLLAPVCRLLTERRYGQWLGCFVPTSAFEYKETENWAGHHPRDNIRQALAWNLQDTLLAISGASYLVCFS